MKKKRLIRLGLLMLLSQLALTAFVAWWIVHQYGNEKASLEKELWRKFAETEQQVVDSVIYKNYVEPLTRQSDSSGQKQISYRRITNTEIHGDPDSLDRKTTISLEINDSSFHGQLPKIGMIRSNKNGLNEVMTGIRMFIAHEPGNNTQIQGEYKLSVEADSALFKRLFAEKTDAMGLDMAWVQKTRTKEKDGKRMILYSAEFNNIPAANINGYNRYLLTQIWPQLVFGVLLVLLTATAFVIAYRSIRTQHRLNMLHKDFISNISHELKTPLSTAKVTIEALKTFDHEKREAVMQEYLNIAEMELDRLDELVTKVLQTGMRERENSFLRLRPVELNALITEVITVFRTRTKDRAIGIIIEPHEPLTLSLDPLHIQGVFHNILDNAVKYHQHQDPLISISTGETDGFITVKIADNGPGIHAEYLDRVFDQFFRVPSGDVHNIKGHGLGLSYTSQVMEKHGGKVTAANNPEGGCTFTLYFPKTAPV